MGEPVAIKGSHFDSFFKMDEKKSVSRKRKRSEGPSGSRKKARVVSVFKGVSKGEMKAVDYSVGSLSQPIYTTMGASLLNGTVPGNGIQNRQARRIQMQSVRIQGGIYQTQAGTNPADDLVHIMVIYDKQPNGVAPVIGDIFQSCRADGTTAANNYSFLNLSNSRRFKVLRHDIMKFDVTGATISQPAQEGTDYAKRTTINWFIPLKGLETQYNTGTAGTVADINSGALYLVTLGGNAVADYQHSLIFNARLRFADN